MAVRSWYSTTTISRDSPSIESISTERVAHSIRHNLLGGLLFQFVFFKGQVRSFLFSLIPPVLSLPKGCGKISKLYLASLAEIIWLRIA